MEGDADLKKLVSTLKKHSEISFDTETTGIDANDAELVGLSFSVQPGSGYYIPVPPDNKKAREILEYFIPLFFRHKKNMGRSEYQI